ncbi:hypothetical protein GOP47_0019431 [Adiantum capillus-veneris]|uniref:Uncharacterized protein n=1 Tax=Adiantum capillus-veneris TaxID=13818 RepID=A0A9D4Z9L7_ADICA|nr:hypothetical protein GOP47_0019431 [Adiantum capillus-veneris]
MRTLKAKGAAASRASSSTCKQKGKAKEGIPTHGRSNNKGSSTPASQQIELENKSSPNTRASAKQFKASEIDSEWTSHRVSEDESKSSNKSRRGKLFIGIMLVLIRWCKILNLNVQCKI